MLQRDGRGGRLGVKGVGRGRRRNRRGDMIEITRAISVEGHEVGLEILHRKIKRVKLNRTRVITGKLMDRDEIFGDFGSYMGICEVVECVK